jgi:hypothetical protein
MSSLFSNLSSESPARVRLLTKFVEGNYEKVDKLLEIRDNSSGRIKILEAEMEQEKKVECISYTLYSNVDCFIGPGSRWGRYHIGRGRRLVSPET